jgi:hypothetical protein
MDASGHRMQQLGQKLAKMNHIPITAGSSVLNAWHGTVKPKSF